MTWQVNRRHECLCRLQCNWVFSLAIALATGPRRSLEGQQNCEERRLEEQRHRQGRSRGLGVGKGGLWCLGRGIRHMVCVRDLGSQQELGGCWACGSFKASVNLLSPYLLLTSSDLSFSFFWRKGVTVTWHNSLPGVTNVLVDRIVSLPAHHRSGHRPSPKRWRSTKPWGQSTWVTMPSAGKEQRPGARQGAPLVRR